MRKVVLIVLNNFKNDSRVLKEAVSLNKNGYIAEVAALHESGLKEKEIIGNVNITRIKLKSKGWSKIFFIQLLKYLEFICRAIGLYKNFDIIHCNDLNALPIGVIIKKFYNKNVKIVYDAHEYETERAGLKGIFKIISKLLERTLIKYADKVLTVSDSIAKEYVRLYGIEKPAVVLNTPGFKTAVKKDLFRDKFSISEDKTIFLFQGRFGKGRGIEIILEAFEKNKDHSSVVVFLGYGELEDLIKLKSEQNKNIYFHPAVSPENVLDYTSSADFGFSTIEDICLSYRYCLPNKIFEYFMVDVPVIVSALPEMKKIVENFSIGIVIEENNADSLQKAIEKALKSNREKMVENIQQIKKIFNWENQEKILLKIYKELYED